MYMYVKVNCCVIASHDVICWMTSLSYLRAALTNAAIKRPLRPGMEPSVSMANSGNNCGIVLAYTTINFNRHYLRPLDTTENTFTALRQKL